jgi:hypothetical protein
MKSVESQENWVGVMSDFLEDDFNWIGLPVTW